MAIQLFQQAVNATPKVHPNLPAFLNNVRISLTRRYNRTQDKKDLEKAIQVSQQAAKLTSEDDRGSIDRLNNLLYS